MKKRTRFLTGTLIALLLLGTAATAAACRQQQAEYPTVTEVTEPQPAGEVIPAVDRQAQLAAAKEKNPDTAACCTCPARRWTTP